MCSFIKSEAIPSAISRRGNNAIKSEITRICINIGRKTWQGPIVKGVMGSNKAKHIKEESYWMQVEDSVKFHWLAFN